MDSTATPVRRPRPWRLAVLSAVLGLAAVVGVSVGALGFLVDILSHMDTPDPTDQLWMVFAVVFFLGFACGVAAFAVALLALVRGPRGPRILAGFGLALALLPVVVVVEMFASTIAWFPSSR